MDAKGMFHQVFEEAYRYARDPNPMASICGRVCAHPCETACRRGQIDRPISIRALMPAALEEIEEAETEGIIMHPGFGPKRVLGRDCKVVGLECLKTKYVFDENHRFNPAFYENSDTQFDCDTIILSIGQAPNLDFLRPEDGVLVSGWALQDQREHAGCIGQERGNRDRGSGAGLPANPGSTTQRAVLHSLPRSGVNAHLVRPSLNYFPGDPDFDGISFSSMVHVVDGSSPLAVEFFFPFRMMRCFAAYDCTGQQLLDSGTVVINGERSALDDLQVAESKN